MTLGRSSDAGGDLARASSLPGSDGGSPFSLPQQLRRSRPSPQATAGRDHASACKIAVFEMSISSISKLDVSQPRREFSNDVGVVLVPLASLLLGDLTALPQEAASIAQFLNRGGAC